VIISWGSLAPKIHTKYQRDFIYLFHFSHHTWQVSPGKMKKIEVGGGGVCSEKKMPAYYSRHFIFSKCLVVCGGQILLDNVP
jgi:hypothetical protein